MKIIAWKKFNKVKSLLKSKKSVLVGGCFDILHYGHLQFFKKAKKTGDFLIVVLESDKFIRVNKKREPIHKQKQRAEILSSLTFVDLVILLPFFRTDKDYFKLVQKIKPSVIAVTKGDFQIENKRKQSSQIGAELRIVSDFIKGFSSKNIIKAFE